MDFSGLLQRAGDAAIALAITLLVLYLLVRTGDLRTRFEAAAWAERARRAEMLVDTLVPAVTALTSEVRALSRLLREATHGLEPDSGLADDGQR